MADIFDIFKRIEKKEQSGPKTVEYLVVGLGNPGDKYFSTRHNTGFLALDYISQSVGVTVKNLKFKALTADTVICGKRVLLMKPQTFMNLSGEAVREAASFYKIPPQNIIVISDDISLDVGRVRVRRKGSDGGQKGLRSIITLMNSDDIPRIKVGVGAKPHPDYDLADWVLSEFSKSDKELMFEAFKTVYAGLEKILSGDIDGAMMLCNHK